MNFKKTLGLVLTAALVSTSLVAVKPAQAATTASAATGSISSFKYFFPERSLLVAGEQDTYVVDTDYSGKVQYELWVKSADDANAKWQVISVDANGKAGYTEAVDGQNSPYAIPIRKDFSFKQGKYYTAVYVKVANTAGLNSYKHYIDTDGVDTDASKGTEQKYDVVKTGYFNAVSTDYKTKYNEMLGDFLFDQSSFVKGQKVTFKGFQGQQSNAKYKLVVRKFGTEASTQQVLNDTFSSNVDWTPDTAGTYQVIAWSEPINAKGADRDGWRIGTVTVTESNTTQATVSTKVADAAQFGQKITTTSDYTGAVKYQIFSADGKTAITSVTDLGKDAYTTGVKTGDAAVVALLDANGATLKTVNVTLGTDAKVDQPTKPTTSSITATVGTANVGSKLTVTTDNKNAASFQVLSEDGTSNYSKSTDIKTSANVYPKVAAGQKVTIKLFDATGAVLATQVVTLQ